MSLLGNHPTLATWPSQTHQAGIGTLGAFNPSPLRGSCPAAAGLEEPPGLVASHPLPVGTSGM